MSKENPKVEVDLESFIEDLWKMADDDFDYDEVQLMEDLVRNDIIGTYSGVTGVINAFNDMEVVRREDFEDKFPKYSKVMTWEEFCLNECIYSHGDVAVMDEK